MQRRHGVAVLNRARAHVDAGELAQAQDLLSQLLATLPTDPRKARPAEAEAAALQTGVLLSLGDAHAARGWAAYGHATFRRLYGEHDRRTLHTLGLLAAVLTRVGAHGRAAQRYQHLIEIFTQLDGPRSERALAARADLATVEHARGQCAPARLHLATVIEEHQAAFGVAHPVGVRMLARLAAMWRDCGDLAEAQGLLAQARANAAGLGREVHELLATAAATPADPYHVCASTSPQAATGEVLVEDSAALSAEPALDVDLADIVAQPGPPPVAETPLARPFSTVSYLPAHPLLTAWEPLPPVHRPPRRQPVREMSPATLALVAAIVGIVAISVLFLLLVSSVRGG